MKLPSQYNSWLAFWKDIESKPDLKGFKRIKVQSGSSYSDFFSSRGELSIECMEYNVLDIKSKAFDEIIGFFPNTHIELDTILSAVRLTPECEELHKKWFEFHRLLE